MNKGSRANVEAERRLCGGIEPVKNTRKALWPKPFAMHDRMVLPSNALTSRKYPQAQ
jgi:hypothetical protein